MVQNFVKFLNRHKKLASVHFAETLKIVKIVK